MRTIARLGLGQRGLYFGLGLAVGLGLAAHGVAASSVSTPCRSGGTTKPPVAVSRPAHQVQLFVSGQHRWRLTLTKVAVVSQLTGTSQTYHAQGKYVVVFLSAQNMGKVPQEILMDQNFALRDGQGRQFGLAETDPNLAAREQYKLDWTVTDVQPTFSVRVAFVFDVARDARGLTLVNVPLGGDRTQKLFTLRI
jgi:hypothetical protein